MTTQRYQITSPRFIDGVYIHASPDEPTVITVDIPENREPDAGLIPLGERVPKPKPHFAGKLGGGVPTAADRHSRPVEPPPRPPEGAPLPPVDISPAGEQSAGKGRGKRPSDGSPV